VLHEVGLLDDQARRVGYYRDRADALASLAALISNQTA
jgi:hypothetical protein